MNNENDAVRNNKTKHVAEPILFDDHEASATLSKNLIAKYHPEIASAVFRFLCKNKASKSGKIPVPGSVKKASPMEKHLCGGECDFIMIIALDVWNDYTPEQRSALVDHLLARCVGEEDPETGDMKYYIRPPQVQEFPEIAERHGKWNQGLVDLDRSLKI